MVSPVSSSSLLSNVVGCYSSATKQLITRLEPFLHRSRWKARKIRFMPLSIPFFSHQHRFIFQFPELETKRKTHSAHCCSREINELTQRTRPINSISFLPFHVCDYKHSQGQLKYIPWPVCLPCSTQRGDQWDNSKLWGARERRQAPHSPVLRPGGRIRWKDLAPFSLTKSFPETTGRSWAPRHYKCFHFLDVNVQTIC